MPLLTFDNNNSNTFAAITLFMRRSFLFLLMTLIVSISNAQSDSAEKANVLNLKPVARSNDHLMFKIGYLIWSGAADSINTGGIPRTANAYFLFDFPFKTNPKLSAAIGAGFGTDHMFFDEMNVGIKDRTPTLRFTDQKDSSHFKKYKLSTVYLEAPVELRFSSRPDDNKKSIKMALGVKVGTLLSAHVKGKNLLDRGDKEINDYKVKEHSKQFFNTKRLAATARIGYGHFSLFGSYQLTSLFKEVVAPKINPVSLGITLSGL
jgi:hypothetical protein